LDKFQRNVGDALTDSGWIGDDSQIIAWFAWKAWADGAGAVGALIRLGAF
jgi:Holliday junction resolvase RusA-like endonuclease